VIADLVGDNVGDCAGRGADLFESTAAENIGAMILGIALFPVFGIYGIIFPLVARAFGLIASIIGVLSVRIKEDEDPIKGLNRGYLVTTILATAGFWLSTKLLLTEYHTLFFLAGLVGILTSFAFVSITQYYTEYRYRPVKSIARASETGPATNIITGFSVALECTGIPVVVISIALLLAYFLGQATGLPHGGLYGTAVATMGMLATCAYILAMDTFGPITDNAGGIVEMSGASENIRKRTDRLDAIGNTTKALTKGYAVGSAALAAFLLFSAYLTDVHIESVDLAKPVVFIGAMMGAVLVFVFSAFAIRAVGSAAYYIINNVRKQFKEKPGILEGKEKPDYAQAVDICTRGALKEMVLPGLTVVIVPLLVGILLGPEAVGATLMVGTIAGIILALVLNNGGGAWDNAKKYIEAGAYGGKGSFAHKAAVVGDTVGDPFKDTAGPSLHVVVKLLSTLTLVFAPLFLILHAVK
ncbi:MAG TPA: sodium-translocating pyrophosphatase, partial [bacterium]|nr:sodium-translocating pyrophosphatase [bacterium]HPP08263.1 sodium-translocating pyrophosphatase [bacterium]